MLEQGPEFHFEITEVEIARVDCTIKMLQIIHVRNCNHPSVILVSDLGPVVQSIVSLPSSLRGHLVKSFMTITKYTDIFC